MRLLDAYGLADGTLSEDGKIVVVQNVEDLRPNTVYRTYGHNSKGVKRIERQLQNQGMCRKGRVSPQLIRGCFTPATVGVVQPLFGSM